MRTLDLMLQSIHQPTVLLTSHILLHFYWQKLSQLGNVKSVWSVLTVLGILPEAALYFMQSAHALLTASNLLTGFFTFLIEC